MDKGVCNSVPYQYYGRKSNMTSSITMYIIGYIILMRNRETLPEWAATPLSCVKVAKLLQ